MPKVVDHLQMRRDILEKATPLFLRHGFAGLTTRELARQLGISTGTLYHYFSSKEALFEDLMHSWMQQDMTWIRDQFLSLPDQGQRIRAIAAFLQEHRAKFDTQNQILLQFCQWQQQRGVDLVPFWEEVYRRWGELLQDLLQLRSQFALDLLCQSLDGLFLQWIQGSKTPDLAQFFDRLAHWLPLIDRGEVSEGVLPL